MKCDHEYGKVQEGYFGEYIQCTKCKNIVNMHEPVLEKVSKWAKVVAPIVQLINLVRGKR